jgi:hypothetical protein
MALIGQLTVITGVNRLLAIEIGIPVIIATSRPSHLTDFPADLASRVPGNYERRHC